jgi:galactose-1-phosphate uridylyltransferase
MIKQFFAYLSIVGIVLFSVPKDFLHECENHSEHHESTKKEDSHHSSFDNIDCEFCAVDFQNTGGISNLNNIEIPKADFFKHQSNNKEALYLQSKFQFVTRGPPSLLERV